LLSFTRRVPFFSKKLSMRMWQLYLYDVIFIVLLAGVYFMVGTDFRGFVTGANTVEASGSDFRMFAVEFIYAPRISSFIAIARHNRQPQVAEWWVTIIALGLAVFLVVFGGFFEAPFAASYGYRACGKDGSLTVFTRQTLPCAAAPAN